MYKFLLSAFIFLFQVNFFFAQSSEQAAFRHISYIFVVEDFGHERMQIEGLKESAEEFALELKTLGFENTLVLNPTNAQIDSFLNLAESKFSGMEYRNTSLKIFVIGRSFERMGTHYFIGHKASLEDITQGNYSLRYLSERIQKLPLPIIHLSYDLLTYSDLSELSMPNFYMQDLYSSLAYHSINKDYNVRMRLLDIETCGEDELFTFEQWLRLRGGK